MDNLLMAVESSGPSRNQLQLLLKSEELRSGHYKKLLNNQYSKFSRHSKQHKMNVTKLESEILQLKKTNQDLSTEKKSLETSIEMKNAEIKSQNDALKTALADRQFFEMLLSHRDQTNARLEQERNELLAQIISFKSKCASMDSNVS